MLQKFFDKSAYNYVFDNPLLFTDPTGMEPEGKQKTPEWLNPSIYGADQINWYVDDNGDYHLTFFFGTPAIGGASASGGNGSYFVNNKNNAEDEIRNGRYSSMTIGEYNNYYQSLLDKDKKAVANPTVRRVPQGSTDFLMNW